jgi:hypothetical protein
MSDLTMTGINNKLKDWHNAAPSLLKTTSDQLTTLVNFESLSAGMYSLLQTRSLDDRTEVTNA